MKRKSPVQLVTNASHSSQNTRGQGPSRGESSTAHAHERAAKVEHLKALVQSGTYFSSRSSRDVAAAVAKGLEEKIEVRRRFAGNE